LTKAIDHIFKKDQVRTMAATYHVLQRYMDYGFTNMDALTKLLLDEQLIDSTENILADSEQSDFVHPAVSFEVKYEVKDKTTEAGIKSSVQEVLNNFTENENALIWMNQEYERTRNAFGWEPLEVTKKDLETATISVDNAWYGGGLHEKVTVEFNYENYDSCSEIADKEKKRLKQLKDFFRLVLENIHQLVPIQEEFVKNGRTWESNKKVDKYDETYGTYEYRVSELFRGLSKNSTALEETVTIFKSLQDKGVDYNTADKILTLLNDKKDIDNLTVKVQKARKGTAVNVISSAPFFVRPEKETRFKELPESILKEIHQLMSRELLSPQLKKRYAELFDDLINTDSPGLFDMCQRSPLGQKVNEFSKTPKSMIATLMDSLRDQNSTLGGLIGAFEELKEEHLKDTKYVSAMTALIEGLRSIMEKAREFSEGEAEKQLAKDRSLETFLKFLKDHPENGMRKYAKAKGFRKDQFLNLAEKQQIVPGDMIGFYRKNLGIEYAHAGIYTPNKGKKYVVHVQAKGGLRSSGKKALIKCQELEEIVTKDDMVFYIRKCEDRKSQSEVISRVEACLFETPIEYTYNGHYGSCQTFCSKLFGSTLFEELNPEAFLTSASGWKTLAGWFLSSENDYSELVDEMDRRFNHLKPEKQDGGLITTCPPSCRIAAI